MQLLFEKVGWNVMMQVNVTFPILERIGNALNTWNWVRIHRDKVSKRFSEAFTKWHIKWCIHQYGGRMSELMTRER